MSTRREDRKNTRAKEARKVVYTPPNELKIDEEVEYKFKQDGFKLRWLRYHAEGTEDHRNIARRSREGYELVRPEELPDSFVANLDEYDSEKRKQSFVTIGDLALAKVPLDLAESRKKYYVDQALDAEDAINREIRENAGGTVPVENSSRSSEATGSKAAKFL